MSILADDSTSSSVESISEDAAVEALISGMGKPKPEAEEGEDEAPESVEVDTGEEADEDEDDDTEEGEEPSEDDEDEPAHEGDEEPAPQPAKAPAEAADDQTIKVTVDGVETTHTVASLKRLAGQEASLTRKSQEADLVGGRAAAALNVAIETALEDLEPYKGVDWLTLQNELDPGEFKWHRDTAAKAQARFDKLVGSAGSFEEGLASRRSNTSVEQAQEAVRELTADVPDWSDKLYGDIMAYGVTQGLSEADVKSISNAKVIKLLRKAMLHDAGAKAVAVKVKAAPTKVLKTTRQVSPDAKAVSTKKSLQRLASGGSDTDAMAVLMGRWA